MGKSPGMLIFDDVCASIAEAMRPHGFRYRKKICADRTSNYLFDIDIENIYKPAPPYIRYDIGDARTREGIVAGIIETMETQVLPFFELLEDSNKLHAALDAGPIPGLDEWAVRDYFACFPL